MREDCCPVHVVVSVDCIDTIEHGNGQTSFQGSPLEVVGGVVPLQGGGIGHRYAPTAAQNTSCKHHIQSHQLLGAGSNIEPMAMVCPNGKSAIATLEEHFLLGYALLAAGSSSEPVAMVCLHGRDEIATMEEGEVQPGSDLFCIARCRRCWRQSVRFVSFVQSFHRVSCVSKDPPPSVSPVGVCPCRGHSLH